MSDDDSTAKHGRPSYPLTTRERQFVATGNPGSYREGEMEKRVQKKIDALPQRVDHLLSDIQLLAHNSYLDDDHWGESWIDFIGFDDTGYRPKADRRVPSTHNDKEVIAEDPDHSDILEACRVSPQPGRARPSSAPEQLAFQFGVALRRLMLFPEGIDEEQMAKEIAWGLTDGFFRGDEPAFAVMGDGRRELKQEFIEYQQNRLEREADIDDEWLQQHEEDRERSDQWMQMRFEMTDLIRDVLYDAGLPIQPKHGGKLKYRDEDRAESLNENLDEYHDETSDDGIFADEVLDHLIDHLVDEPDDIDDDPLIHNEPGTSGQWNLFQRQYGPLEEFDPAEVVDEDDVLTIVSENYLVAKGKLNVLVKEDTGAIEDAHWKNVEATEVLEQVVEQDGKVRSADIAKEIGDVDDKAAVTKLCTDLAGREFERAILEGDNTGWSLTPYGELLVEDAFGYFFGPVGGHKSGPDEAAKIDAAAAQISVEDWEYSRKE
ncbi:hypothetical protein [Halorhabdus amylolytica]|uniref:hypothetical protein n=1 Tax=Halorhabdus amylolytica TaxID=2559573 RepID=UPI0010AB3435|nr:hypothetical protein [Halorhabdus amylolytica]